MRKVPLHYADLLLPHFHNPASTNGTNFVGVLMLFSSLLMYALTLAYACKHAVSSWAIVIILERTTWWFYTLTYQPPESCHCLNPRTFTIWRDRRTTEKRIAASVNCNFGICIDR